MLQAAESILSRWEIRQEMLPAETVALVDIPVLTSAVSKARGKFKIKGQISAISKAGDLMVLAVPARVTDNKGEEQAHRPVGPQISKW